MANIVKFYYFQNQNEYNTFLSSNTVDSAALYVIGAEGLLYRGNELIAENSLNLIQALNEINQTQNNAIETNSKNIESLDELIATLQQEQLELEESLKNKVEVVAGKGLSTNDYTNAEKTKLAGIEEGANKTIIDSSLSSTSTNPVQNKVIYSALGNKADKSITINGKSLSSNITLDAEDVGAIDEEDLLNHNTSENAHSDIRNLIGAQAGSISGISTILSGHIDDEAIHITQEERENWNSIKSAFSSVKIGDNVFTPKGHEGLINLIAGEGISLSMSNNATDADITINNLVSETSVETGTVNGTISVNGEDIKVKGLGSAAYTDSTAYATPASIEQVLTDSNQYTDNTVSTHASNTTLHPTAAEKDLWDTVKDKVDKVSGKGLSTNDYTDAEKTKLAGIATGAEVNQPAFSKVTVGSTTIEADSKTDILTLVAGSNITLTPDTTNNKITISATDTTYEAADSALGLVKSGGDVSISNGVITVNDDSHNHTIENIDGLESALEAKVPTARTINNKALTANISLTASDVGADPNGAASGVQSNLDTHIEDTSLHFTTAEKTKLSGIETGAQVNTVTGVKGEKEETYRTGNINITKDDIYLGNVDNTSDMNKPVSNAQGIAIEDALNTAKQYTNTKTSGLASSSSVSSAISNHNISTSAHSDIRELIDGLTTRLNALADSDDTTLDQMSEIVEYIKSNKSLIEDITTNKINVSDIVDNLTTSSDSKVLSAKQGVAIKTLIDNLQSVVEGKANSSDLTSHTGNTVIHITSAERTQWNKAEENQPAFSKIEIGDAEISANSETDTLILSAGNGISLTPTTNNNTISIANTGVLSVETGATNGTISVDGDDVAVKGLDSAAYKSKGYFEGLSTTAETNAKDYADGIKTELKENLNTTNANLTTLSNNITNIINGTTTVKKAESATTSTSATTATTATKVGTTTVGGTKQPIYLEDGVPTTIGYTIETSVPPKAVFTDTTYTAGDGLALNGTEFIHPENVDTASNTNPSIPSQIPSTGVTSLAFGGGITIPSVTYNKQGHITGRNSTTFLLPPETGVSYKVNSTIANQPLGYEGEITVQNPIGVDGQQTTFSNVKYKLPKAQTLDLEDTTTPDTVSLGGTFTAISAIDINQTDNNYTLSTATTTYTIPGLSKGSAGTDSATLSHEGTFTAVSDIKIEGHTITQTNKTFKLPSETPINIASGGDNVASNATVIGGLSTEGHEITATKKTLVAGDNVTISASNNNITISATSTDDIKVKQGNSTTASYRSLLMGYNTLDTSTTAPSEVTNQVYAATGISAQPSTGTIRVSQLNIGDGAFLSWDSTSQALVISFA